MIRELLNVFTKGTKGIKVFGDPKLSSLNIPVNEDWSFTGIILNYNETTGIVQVRKGWDQAAGPKVFYAMAGFPGRPEKPTAQHVQVGKPVEVMRVGEFNNNPSAGWPYEFELRTAAANKVSFLAFFFTR